MSSPVVFITGVSGYIGGHLVGSLVQKHPEYTLITLVRNEEQAKVVHATWPKVETVIGDLDSHDILVEQGKKADVVLQLASADHIGAGKSIMGGLSQGKKGRYVHISGTGMLHDVANGYGNPSEKVYRDVSDFMEITSLDDTHVHREVDASVIAVGEKYRIKTAIVSPPTIHGIGKGPMKKRSIQIPFLTEAILKRGKAFTVGEGHNIWDNIHIDDLANAYVVLLEEAVKTNGGKAAWGREGYYFVEAAEHTWRSVVEGIAKVAHGKGALKTEQIEKLSVEDASAVHPWAPLLWGGNARSRADRLRALGWKPTGQTIYESLPEMVGFEIDATGPQSTTTTF